LGDIGGDAHAPASPICNRSAIHFTVTIVSARRRFNFPRTIPSTCAAATGPPRQKISHRNRSSVDKVKNRPLRGRRLKLSTTVGRSLFRVIFAKASALSIVNVRSKVFFVRILRLPAGA
jgi:hypothetical protein